MDAPTITAAALDTLGETGLDKLTMRAVADRLDVRVGGLYYHHPDKSALLRSMADLLCRRALEGFDGHGHPSPAVTLCLQLREVLRAHRDGARLLAAAPMNGSAGALALMEYLIELLEGEVDADRAHIAADTLMSYVTGFVLQEQVGSGTAEPAGMSAAELSERFPRVLRGAAEDDETVFRSALEAITVGFSRDPDGPPPGGRDRGGSTLAGQR